MRKEIFFAIIAGAIFGLVIAFGIWRANKTIAPEIKQADQETAETDSTSSPLPKSLQLTIAEPEANDVFTENSTTVSGLTKPDAWLAISTENEDEIIQSDEKGAFEQEIDLAAGANEIIVTSFDQSGKSEEKKLLVVYSSQLDDTEEESSENE